KAGAIGIQPEPQGVLDRVLHALEYDGPLTILLVVFVGALEDNAFMYRDGDNMVVCIPIEQDPAKRTLMLPHELAHAIHFAKAKLSGAWERSIATTILSEGVAIHTATVVEPIHPVEAHIEHAPGWWQECTRNKQQ